MPIVPVSTGIRLNYEDVGSGEPILMIMGTGADHTLWAPTIPAYVDEYRVITFDQRGTGKSDHPDDPSTYTATVLAEDAVALLDALGVDAAHISGLSLGSAVAQELAIAYPRRVRTLQLHSTWGKTDAWLLRLFESMAYPVERGDLEAFARMAFMMVMSPTMLNDFPDEVAEIERQYLANPPSRNGLLGHLHADRTHDSLDRLINIQAPTLITSGEMDWQVPTRYGEEVDWWIPNSRLHVFSGPFSSHMAYSEMAEEFNEVTLDFLRIHPER